MYNFILQLIVMLSLGTIIYLIARAAPRVTEAEAPVAKDNYIDKLMRKIPLEKMDALTGSLYEKFLRKLKVVILRLDNFVSEHLRRLKPIGSGSPAEKPALFEKAEEKTGNKETGEIK